MEDFNAGQEIVERARRERAAQLLPFQDFCSYSLRTREWKGWEHQEEAERIMNGRGWSIVCWAPGTLWLNGKSAHEWPHSKWVSQTTGEFMELAFARPSNWGHVQSATFHKKFQIYHIEMQAILGEGRDSYPYYVVLRKSQVHNTLAKTIEKLLCIQKMPSEDQKMKWLVEKIAYEQRASENRKQFKNDMWQDWLKWRQERNL